MVQLAVEKRWYRAEYLFGIEICSFFEDELARIPKEYLNVLDTPAEFEKNDGILSLQP